MDSGASHGHNFDTSPVYLDLYRLNCIFQASKPIADTCLETGDCPIRLVTNEYEKNEITRLVISISVFGRMMDDKLELMKQDRDNVVEMLEQMKQSRNWFHEPVGELIPDLNDKTTVEPLELREAFNKVLHTTKMNFDVVERKGGARNYLRPYLYLYGKKGCKEWKATLNVYDFIRNTSILGWHL